MEVVDSYESARGCGHRKKSGLYLVAPETGTPCGFLPIVLDLCPCCGEGFRFSRTPRWVTTEIFGENQCQLPIKRCAKCWFPNIPKDEKLLLMWIGRSFYNTPEDFMRESTTMGISRRIKFIPKGFEVGKTVVLLAHVALQLNKEQSIQEKKSIYDKGIFSAFIPRAIQYIVNEDDSIEYLESLHEKGIELINVIPIENQVPNSN